MIDKTAELLVCPFCGGEDAKAFFYADTIPGEPDAFCQCQGCSTTGPSGADKAEAITAWNRRANVSTQSPGSDRVADHQAFEGWCKTSRHPEGAYALDKTASGEYIDAETRCAFRGWTAGRSSMRANVSTQSTDAPEALISDGKIDMSTLATWPERIYLQIDDDKIPDFGSINCEYATWCVDQIGDCDVEYVRADLAKSAIDAALLAELDALRAVFFEMLDKKVGSVDAPGHDHKIPGVWDDDAGNAKNGKAGKPCEWCAIWNRAKKLAMRPSEAHPPKFNESEFSQMVERGTKAWAGTPDNWLEELRGGASVETDLLLIEVEKLLCVALNRKWVAPGMSIGPLIGDLEKQGRDAINAAVLAEREACALICEEVFEDFEERDKFKYPEQCSNGSEGADSCARAIRTRSESACTGSNEAGQVGVKDGGGAK